ncbi:hypothetical protein ACFMBG_19645 [Leisingera sp. D0M16]|uniref:hypothetical protein n=1 Tax=Leisingera coralii TaxID=3351347 RepID=UPI003B7D639C
MTRPEDASGVPARLWLREATHRLHLDLHAHPLYRRLPEPDLTYQELRATAAVTYSAAGVVEASRDRRQIWPELSLSDHLQALERDLGDTEDLTPQPGQSHLGTEAGLLGALYVIHGSAFGAASLAKPVRRAVPSAPKSFLMPREAEAWRFLCQLLDAVSAADFPLLAEGAKEVFHNYKRLADFQLQICRASSPLGLFKGIPLAGAPAWPAASR